MVDHEMPAEFCDDSGAVVHAIEAEPVAGVGVLMWSARRRQMRFMTLRDADRDSLGLHVLVAALQEMLRDV